MPANRILGPTAAVPSLALGLQKIARTPRPRLQVGYKIVPRQPCIPPPGCGCGVSSVNSPPQARPGAFVEFLSRDFNHAQLQLIRKLGAELYLERLLAGGIVGEVLPLSNLQCDADHNTLAPGGQFDACC
jgi:hypothetical protein